MPFWNFLINALLAIAYSIAAAIIDRYAQRLKKGKSPNSPRKGS